MKTIACVIVTSDKVFSWLGHMPVMLWSISQLVEVRGVSRVACCAAPKLADRARQLLAKQGIEVVSLPPQLARQPDEKTLEKWLCSAGGPAPDADALVVVRPTTPFLPAAKIEACVRHVARGKCAACVPARVTSVVGPARTARAYEAVPAVRAFRVQTVPDAAVNLRYTEVSLLESLDVEAHDQFVLASAMVEGNKV
jgi:hypothetical protein